MSVPFCSHLLLSPPRQLVHLEVHGFEVEGVDVANGAVAEV